MQSFRTGTISKSISVTTLSFFLWTFFAAPLANAIEADNLKQQQKQAQLDAMYETSPEATLAYRLQKLKDKITHEIPEQQSQQSFWDKTRQALGAKPISTSLLDAISAIEASIWQAEQEGMKGFDVDEQTLLQNKKLSKELKQLAQQRHREAKQQVQQRFVELKQKLHALQQADDANAQQQAFDDLKTFLEKQQFQKGHTAVDPEHLPFGTPKREERAPLENETALYMLTHDPVLVASNVLTPEILGPKFTQRGGTQTDLAETIDTVQTQAIKDLAIQLHNDPIEIYTWVANNIRFVPSYGSIQGADMTLQTKRGNAMDTSSLLIALLRAAHIPARYAYGTVQMPVDKAMNWVGGVTVPAAAANLMQQGGIPTSLATTNGVITHIKFEHTWVEAFVDYEPSRGVKNIEGDNWVPMDASYKQYEFTQPTVNLQTAVPFDAQGLADTIQQNTTVNEAEGWVQSNTADPAQLQTQIQSALTDYQTNLQNYLTTQQPDATVGDVLGLQQVKILPARPLAAGLPYQMITKQSTFSEVADSQRLKFKYELYTQSYGEKDQLLFKVEQPTVQLAGKKLAMSFKPATQQDADLIDSYIPEPDPTTGQIDPNSLPSSLPGYLIHLIPEFSIDNATVTNATASMTMGTELISTMGYKFPNKGYETTDNMPIAGQYEAIALDLQGVSEKQTNDIIMEMSSTLTKLDVGDYANTTKQDVVGDLLYSTVYIWFSLNNIMDELSAQSMEIVKIHAPSYGIFQSKLIPVYFFGISRKTNAGGMVMDIDHYYVQAVSKINSLAAKNKYIRSCGEFGSSMEHIVPEQVFSTTGELAFGISTMKAIDIANQEGQKLYYIDENNVDIALNDITLSASAESDIRNAVMSGMKVIAHQADIVVNGAFASGYIVLNSETGAGAYLLDGGESGTYLHTATQYRMLYGAMAHDTIRVDRKAAERITYSEALRNAEHFLYAYQKVCDEGQSRAKVVGLVYIYWISKALIYDANILRRGPITIPGVGTFDFRKSTLTFEQLAAGLTGAALGSDCSLH